jgi:hypothetical protein
LIGRGAQDRHDQEEQGDHSWIPNNLEAWPCRVGTIEEMSSTLWYWLLPIAICAPWIVGIAWTWARLPKDGWIPQSAGELARQRLEVR